MGPTLKADRLPITCLRCGQHYGWLPIDAAIEPPMFWVGDHPCPRCDGTLATLYPGYDPSPELLISLRAEAILTDQLARAKSKPPPPDTSTN